MPRSHLCLGLAHKDQARAGDFASWETAARSFVRCRDLAYAQRDAAMASRALNNLGSVAYEVGQVDIAEGYYTDALDLVPDYDDAIVNLATVRFRRAQEARDKSMLLEAIDGYRMALALRPTHAQAWGNLSLALEAIGDRIGAVEARTTMENLR